MSDTTLLERQSEPAPPDRSGPGEARVTAYDVVVIGAGIGGLTAGALLARAGKKVLVVEAEAAPGGYARALRRGAYVFDRADHLIMGCSPESPFGPGAIDAVLRHLGVRDRCDFIRMDDPFYQVVLPGLRLTVPTGREAFIEAHARHFPGEADGLRRLAELSAALYRETQSFPLTARLRDLLLAPRRYPTVFRYRNAVTQQVLDRELRDPHLKTAYSALWPWIGPPPSRASFIFWGGMMGSFVEDGAYYCRGSFQVLADALRAGLEAAGGELLLGTRVRRVLAQRRRVQGIELENGQRIRAAVVVANIDARPLFDGMLDPEQVPARYRRRLRALEPSDCLVALYAATDLDVRAAGAAHEMEVFGEWDIDRVHARALAGEVPALSLLIPTLKDPALAPPGEHLVILKGIAPAGFRLTPEIEARFADGLLALAEQVLPGLGRHLTFVDQTGTDAIPHSRLHVLGPVYGWAATPGQVAALRPRQRTPIAGLVLAGHWTQPGHGIATVLRSGIGAARLVLEAPSGAPALPLGV